ncbi:MULTISPECIES: DUF1853 family protein [unclassified Duganella]|uniref:DUF1853 family protein n=1 Tax=unclassified Duganella TaxID=2636909 RepID=UPI000891A8F8|nr:MULTISPECIES: DUF1853 family protein [unclassified Duganella]SDG37734.1 hypothetical protein SAMN05216320_104117 [Duganella sp. OV458]SDJ65944.1 hypothetical protein SAMN05428973_105287 [Duganella sp. OV510]
MPDQPPGAPAEVLPGAAGPTATATAAARISNYQAQFESRWPQLSNPHVRALAWLLDAPDLLDPQAPHWQGRIASLGALSPATADWLTALEHDPSPLQAALGDKHYSRLGLYAEKLMAFYFAEQGQLYAHGLQVRADRTDTIGEFDFLLREDAHLVHIEFATKFYLLDNADGFNGLIGPNLADTLGVKMRKIFDKQLSLSQHPVAQALVPQEIARAQALVKGWLFYPDGVQPMPGISQQHCHGFWITQTQAQSLPAQQQYAIMPRLQWLAPLKLAAGAGISHEALLTTLQAHSAPVMIAALNEKGDWLVEERRGFVVPDDWRQQARQRRQDGALPA